MHCLVNTFLNLFAQITAGIHCDIILISLCSVTTFIFIQSCVNFSPSYKEEVDSHDNLTNNMLFIFTVRISGPSVPALDYRRDCYNAHSCSPCHGHPADSGAT